MDRIDIGLLGMLITLLLIAVRVPIAVAMGLVAFGGIWMMMGPMPAIGISKAVPYDIIGDWNLSAVPMFLLMGYVASGAGLTEGLFKAARVLLNRVPGGLAIASVASSALFASASGSSVATAAAFSRIAIPEMLKAGYNKSLASGSVAAAGTLGSLIPPSVLLIIYGLTMNVSIASLFLAAVIPGILSGIVFAVMIAIRCKANPALAPRIHETYSLREKITLLRETWPLPVIITGVLGGIFAGVFTATEGGAIGAALALLIAVVRRTLSWPMVRRALMDTVNGTATIFIIVVAAALFSRFVALSTLPTWVADQLSGLDMIWIIFLICVLYLVLGCFLESISIILLTVPVLAPLLGDLGINTIWFGVLMVKLLETGLITPPVGMNVYVIRSSLGPEMPLGTIFRGASWFILADAFTIALLIAFPALTLWLPGLVG